MIRFLLCAIAGATLCAVPAAADSLAGKVKDPQGAVVAGAEITLQDRVSGSQRTAFSNGSGEYRIEGLAGGAYLMEASGSGAALGKSEEVAVAGATTHDVTLDVARSTMRVSVIGTQTPLAEQEVAKSIDVITGDDLNLRDEFSISEAVRNIPGVRVRQLEGPGSFTSIQTRGMKEQYTAVLIDGLRFRDPSSITGDATGFIEDLELVDTSRIEFLRGAGSSLYGTHAVGGVLNITSNAGGGDTRGAIRAEGGGLGFLRGTGNLSGSLAKSRLVYSGGFSHVNVVNGIRGNYPYRNTGGQGFAKYQFNKKMSLSARVWGAGSFLRGSDGAMYPGSILANFPATGPVAMIPLPEDQVTLFAKGLPFNAGSATFVPSVADPDYSRKSRFVSGAATFLHELSDNTSYRVAYQGVATQRKYLDGPQGVSGFEPTTFQNSDYRGRTDLVQARLDSRVGRMQLINVGYEFEHESYLDVESGPVVVATDPHISISQLSNAVYGQDQFRLFDSRLMIAVSGRVQTFNVRGLNIAGTDNPYTGVKVQNPENAYTGDVSVAYLVRSSQTKFRAHGGNTYRAPSDYERFGASYYQGFYSYYGDPRLAPEKAKAYDAGIDQYLMHGKARVTATWFYTDLSNSIIFDFSTFPQPDPFGRFGGYRNSKTGGIARGAELSGQVSPWARTDVQVNYTFTNSDQRTPTIGTNFYEALVTSKHQFTATVTQRVTRRLNLTVDWFVASKYTFASFDAFGRQLVFTGPNKTDIVANYKLPLRDTRSIELYGKLNNAFDVRYFETGSTSPGIWGIVGMKYNF